MTFFIEQKRFLFRQSPSPRGIFLLESTLYYIAKFLCGKICGVFIKGGVETRGKAESRKQKAESRK